MSPFFKRFLTILTILTILAATVAVAGFCTAAIIYLILSNNLPLQIAGGGLLLIVMALVLAAFDTGGPTMRKGR